VLTALGAGSDRPGDGTFLRVRLDRLAAAADNAIAAARAGDFGEMRQYLRRFDTLTSAIWTVQSRIGIDRIAGAASGWAEALAFDGSLSSYRVTDFAGLAPNGTGPAWWSLTYGGRTNGRPVTWTERCTSRSGRSRAAPPEVPVGQVWLYCASGLHASIAASILDRAETVAFRVTPRPCRTASLSSARSSAISRRAYPGLGHPGGVR
jgi:hypothetical protein